MWRSIGRVLNGVSHITRRWSLRCGPPAPLITPMGLMREGRMGMRLRWSRKGVRTLFLGVELG